MADEEDLVAMEKVIEALEDLGIELNAEIKAFLGYLVFRQTDSVTHMNYKKFLEIYEEGYLLEESPYEQDLDHINSRDSLKQTSDLESPARSSIKDTNQL